MQITIITNEADKIMAISNAYASSLTTSSIQTMVASIQKDLPMCNVEIDKSEEWLSIYGKFKNILAYIRFKDPVQ